MKNEKVLTQAMIISMFCWGLGWASNKVLSGYGSATAISFYRLLITTISLLVIGFFLKEKITFNLINKNGTVTAIKSISFRWRKKFS